MGFIILKRGRGGAGCLATRPEHRKRSKHCMQDRVPNRMDVLQGEGHGRRGGGELICFDVPSAVLHCSAPPTGPPHHQHCVYIPLLADHPRPLRPAHQPRWSTISAKTNLKYHSYLSDSDRCELFLKICRCRPETFSQFKETWERGPCRHRRLHRKSGNHCSRRHPFTRAGIGACTEPVEIIVAGTTPSHVQASVPAPKQWKSL